jgi:predicted adenine nucleotide alpha hydrolase (AANH) superfamily ATPase
MKKPADKPGLLLHGCCAPCITAPLIRLISDYRVTVFFYNPNIHPDAEYRKRLEEVERLSKEWDFPLIEGRYDPETWEERTVGLENEPEGGARCLVCFRMRMEETCRAARELGMDTWTTTLTVSPHKPAAVIHRIGRALGEEAGVPFLEADFKKKDGFKISCELSRRENLYRQNYCGCRYSMRGSKGGDRGD